MSIIDYVRNTLRIGRMRTPDLEPAPSHPISKSHFVVPLIDPKDLAAKFSLREHVERADRYFSTLNLDSPVVRKPFASALEAVELTSGVAAILSNLFLFTGAKVLDFGAGTCWLSRTLALLGCDVTAADVSRNALRIGEELIRCDPLARHLNVTFAPLDEDRLPFPDASFDRIVCFDALHHCFDQHLIIREFFRVLRSDGIAAFHEPGPRHSQQSQSQHEMRTFRVIEGDIVIEDLAKTAKDAGFRKVELAVFSARPTILSVAEFNEFMGQEHGGDTAHAMASTAQSENQNRRVFFLHKGDVVGRLDSRSPLGLLAKFDAEADYCSEGIRVHGTVTNIGAAAWLPSSAGLGSVNIGVHLHDASGELVNNDFARFALAQERVPHGRELPLAFTIPFPESQERFTFVVDLVAEGVTWFEPGTSVPLHLTIDRNARMLSRT